MQYTKNRQVKNHVGAFRQFISPIFHTLPGAMSMDLE